MNISVTSSKTSMWYDDLPNNASWSGLWNDYIICGRCRGIRGLENACRVCGTVPSNAGPLKVRDADGREIELAACDVGGEGRYEDWIYLGMIEREWKRPVLADDRSPGTSSDIAPSPRAAIVILFWSYFETRIERLLRAGLRGAPERLVEDSLRRYSSIGVRMNEFYRIVFGSTYREDLAEIGHSQIWPHLALIQERRNSFAHGQPQAIDDVLVQRTVEMLKAEHESWIAVFNKRTAHPQI
jgi:hypothetical protein